MGALEARKKTWRKRVELADTHEWIAQVENRVSMLEAAQPEPDNVRLARLEAKYAELEQRYMWLWNMVGRVSMANETEAKQC